MSDWDHRWMSLAAVVSSWSKDRTTKIGAVIVDDRQVLLSVGWNGFPRGVEDDLDIRHERPAKYQWTEHAERNAIYNAAAKGVELRGSTLYTDHPPTAAGFPCADCARAIIQAGIAKIVVDNPDWDNPRWGEECIVSKKMLEEAGVEVRFL